MMGRSGEEGRSGGAVYTTASVPIYWAGAVTQKLLAFSWAGAVSPPSGGRGGRELACVPIVKNLPALGDRLGTGVGKADLSQEDIQFAFPPYLLLALFGRI